MSVQFIGGDHNRAHLVGHIRDLARGKMRKDDLFRLGLYHFAHVYRDHRRHDRMSIHRHHVGHRLWEVEDDDHLVYLGLLLLVVSKRSFSVCLF